MGRVGRIVLVAMMLAVLGGGSAAQQVEPPLGGPQGPPPTSAPVQGCGWEVGAVVEDVDRSESRPGQTVTVLRWVAHGAGSEVQLDLSTAQTIARQVVREGIWFDFGMNAPIPMLYLYPPSAIRRVEIRCR
jgi:hypothetical protein